MIPEDEPIKKGVLIFTDVLFPDTVGGAGRVAKELSDALARIGLTVHVVSRNISGRFPDTEMILPNYKIHRFRLRQKNLIVKIWDEIRNSILMTKYVLNHAHFEFVLAHQSLPVFGPIFTGLLKGKTIVYFFHSPWAEEYRIKYRLITFYGILSQLGAIVLKLIENRIVRKADYIIVISEFMKKKAMRIHKIPPEKIVLLPVGIDCEKFDLPVHSKERAKKKIKIPKDRTFFFTARNLVPRMGLENLLVAFANSDLLKKDALIFIAGEGPMGNILKSQIKQYRLEGSVKLLGHITDDELIKLYQAADFFILPTVALEGFGLVILEALACGTPVIGSPVGAISEILTSFDPRLLMKSESPVCIRKTLESVLLHRDSFSFSPDDCRKFVIDRYSWDKMAAAFQELLFRGAKPPV